jgi:hypothetical protein
MVLRCESLEPLMSQLGQNRLTPLVRLGLLTTASARPLFMVAKVAPSSSSGPRTIIG